MHACNKKMCNLCYYRLSLNSWCNWLQVCICIFVCVASWPLVSTHTHPHTLCTLRTHTKTTSRPLPSLSLISLLIKVSFVKPQCLTARPTFFLLKNKQLDTGRPVGSPWRPARTSGAHRGAKGCVPGSEARDVQSAHNSQDEPSEHTGSSCYNTDS